MCWFAALSFELYAASAALASGPTNPAVSVNDWPPPKFTVTVALGSEMKFCRWAVTRYSTLATPLGTVESRKDFFLKAVAPRLVHSPPPKVVGVRRQTVKKVLLAVEPFHRMVTVPSALGSAVTLVGAL